MIKQLMSAAVVAGVAALLVGCSASIEPDHGSGSGSSYDKQTTTVQHPDGSVDQTTKTQTSP